MEWKLAIIVDSGNGGIPFAKKITIDFMDEGIDRDECEFLSRKIKEYVAKNEEYKFDYSPSCIGVNKPKQTFRTTIAIKLTLDTSEEDYVRICNKYLKEFEANFVQYYTEQKKEFKDNPFLI